METGCFDKLRPKGRHDLGATGGKRNPGLSEKNIANCKYLIIFTYENSHYVKFPGLRLVVEFKKKKKMSHNNYFQLLPGFQCAKQNKINKCTKDEDGNI